LEVLDTVLSIDFGQKRYVFTCVSPLVQFEDGDRCYVYKLSGKRPNFLFFVFHLGFKKKKVGAWCGVCDAIASK
jgi:hypothetical protein